MRKREIGGEKIDRDIERRKGDWVRLDHERKSDGLRVDHEKKRDGVTVHDKKER